MDYGILSGVVARWSLALGVEMFLPPPTREVGVKDDTDGRPPEVLRRDETRWLYFADFYGRNVSIVIDVAPLTELAAALLRLRKSIDLDMVGMRGWPFQGNPFVHEELAPLPAVVRVLDASGCARLSPRWSVTFLSGVCPRASRWCRGLRWPWSSSLPSWLCLSRWLCLISRPS